MKGRINMLTKEEKAQIINNLIKNLESTKYYLEQELAAENFVGSGSDGWIESTNNQINSINSKIQYLNSVLTGL
jgi:hypothetical protein